MALGKTAHVEIVEFGKSLSTVYYKDYPSVEELARVYKNIKATEIFVAGHTCSLGTNEVNDELSQARAKSVKLILSRYGVDPTFVKAKGYGERAPISSNANESSRRKNRRVVASFVDINDLQLAQLMKELKGNRYLRLIKSENSKVDFDIASKNEVQSFEDDFTNLLRQNKIASEVKKPVEEPRKLATAEEPAAEIESAEPKAVEVEEVMAPKKSKSLITTKVIKPKIEKPFSISGFFGPNGDSQYYDEGLPFQSERLNFLGLGLNLEYQYTNPISFGLSFYYLSSSLKEGGSSIDFQEGDKVDFSNLTLNLDAKYSFYNYSKYKVKTVLGINSHSHGGIFRTGILTANIVNYNHLSVGAGLEFDYSFLKEWKLNTRLAYQIPISLSDVEDFDSILWYSGRLSIAKSYTQNLSFIFDYSLEYRESDVALATGFNSRLEFLSQSFMAGLKYNF